MALLSLIIIPNVGGISAEFCQGNVCGCRCRCCCCNRHLQSMGQRKCLQNIVSPLWLSSQDVWRLKKVHQTKNVIFVLLVWWVLFCFVLFIVYRGRRSVVRESEFKSGDRGRVRPVFLSLRVNSCGDFFVSGAPSCVRHAPKIVRTVKIPHRSVVKE